MNGIEMSDPFGRPGAIASTGWIASVLVSSIVGSVWPPSAGSDTPPFDSRRLGLRVALLLVEERLPRALDLEPVHALRLLSEERLVEPRDLSARVLELRLELLIAEVRATELLFERVDLRAELLDLGGSAARRGLDAGHQSSNDQRRSPISVNSVDASIFWRRSSGDELLQSGSVDFHARMLRVELDHAMERVPVEALVEDAVAAAVEVENLQPSS